MKTLYESILDNDFDVNDNAVAATTRELISFDLASGWTLIIK